MTLGADAERLGRLLLRIGYWGLVPIAIGTIWLAWNADVPYLWGVVAAVVWANLVVAIFLYLMWRRRRGKGPEKEEVGQEGPK